MPYKSERKGLVIPRELNRNIKLSEDDKCAIVDARRSGTTYQKIADQFGVSKKRVMQICNRIEKSNKNQFFFLASTCHYFLGSFLNGHP